MSGNKIVLINQFTFHKNVNLVWLDLGRNSIDYNHPSTFGNASMITDLNLSGNKITSMEPETFSVNVKLNG
jgi:hypothetical protein